VEGAKGFLGKGAANDVAGAEATALVGLAALPVSNIDV
jgi:hypothetical protein